MNASDNAVAWTYNFRLTATGPPARSRAEHVQGRISNGWAGCRALRDHMASKSMAARLVDRARRDPPRRAFRDVPASVDSATAQLRELLRSLEELETARRAVLILAELEELAPEEVAEALEVPLATAYARLRAARRAFQESFVERRDIAS